MIEYHNTAKLAEFFALIAEHGAENVEWRHEIGGWYPAHEMAPVLQGLRLADCRLRQRKQYTVRAEVPAPLRKMPCVGDTMWCISLGAYDGVGSLSWKNDGIDRRLFERGLCFATRDDAEANYRAMVDRSEE